MSGNGQVAVADFGVFSSSSVDHVHTARSNRECVAIQLARWATILGAIDLFGCIAGELCTFPTMGSLSLTQQYAWLGAFGFAGTWALLARVLDVYGRRTLLAGIRANLRRGLLAATLALSLVLLLAFMSGLIVAVSRSWFMIWTAWVLIVVVSTRLVWVVALDRAMNRGRCIERAMVIAETADAATRLSEAIRRESDGRIGVMLSVAVPEPAGASTLALIDQAIRDGRCERVILGGCEQKPQSFQSLINRLSLVAIDITVIPQLTGLEGPVTSVGQIGALPTLGRASLPLTPMQSFLKRAEDLVIASVALLLLAPFLVIIAICVKLDSRGPVLFSQPREGYNGRVFNLLKFRTMYIDQADRLCLRQTSRDDPRVTPFGSLLRRTSLDELPQLINVLRGEMSVVGPRPHAIGMTTLGVTLRELLATYDARHRLRPGITGWAQVRNCRGEITTVEKLRRRVFLDCEYISRWSLALDFWIILKTVFLVFNDNDAY